MLDPLQVCRDWQHSDIMGRTWTVTVYASYRARPCALGVRSSCHPCFALKACCLAKSGTAPCWQLTRNDAIHQCDTCAGIIHGGPHLTVSGLGVVMRSAPLAFQVLQRGAECCPQAVLLCDRCLLLFGLLSCKKDEVREEEEHGTGMTAAHMFIAVV